MIERRAELWDGSRSTNGVKTPLRTAVLAALVLGGLIAVPVGAVDAPAMPTTRPDLSAIAVPVVELAGTGTQIGTAEGAEQLDAIHALLHNYLDKFVPGGVRRFVAMTEASTFEGYLRPEHRAEVAALAQSVHVDEREAMLAQCFLDIAQLSGCSTVTLSAAASPDGVPRFGRNLDFWSLDIADKYSRLYVVHGDGGRYAYASVGWPGLIGVLSGMNEHGLCLSNMEVPRDPRLPTAMPYTLLYRTVLERCRTVDEAIKLLETTPRQTANNLMLMDATGARAVAEITPDGVHVRRPKGTDALISTNHQRDQDADTPGRCDRYDYIHATAAEQFGHDDVAAIESMLAHVGRRGTLQSMVFEPTTRTIYLSVGTNAAKRPFTKVELGPLFDKR